MQRSVLLLALLVFCAFLAGRWTQAGEEEPAAAKEVVRALRYRIVWADSALDLSHGGGRWVHEVFFPDAKLTATLVFESHTMSEGILKFETRARLYVGRADKPRPELTGLPASPPSPVEEIEVPVKLAKAVAAYADLGDRYRAEGTRLGTVFTSSLGLKQLPGQAWPSPLSDDESPSPSEK